MNKLQRTELRRLVATTLQFIRSKSVSVPFSRDGCELICPSREMGVSCLVFVQGQVSLSFALTEVRALYCYRQLLLPMYERCIAFVVCSHRGMSIVCPFR